jgi:hypothetical protein
MNITSYMPQYGTREHKQMGMFLLMLLMVAIATVLPDIANAATAGDFKPNGEIITNVDSSFRAWWKALAVPAFWLSLGGLVFCVLFLGSKGWYIPLALAAIFMFGTTLVDGVKGIMG